MDFIIKKLDIKTCHTRKDCEGEFCEDGTPSPGLAQPVLAAIINDMSTMTCEERASFHSTLWPHSTAEVSQGTN